MADHDVKFTVPERELKRAPVKFKVRRKKRPYGTLFIGEGGLKWVPTGKWKNQGGYRRGWKDVADFMVGQVE